MSTDIKKKNKQLVVAVGLIEHESQFLLTRRVSPDNSEWHHKWQLPGGKIDAGETPKEALYREILEETSLEVKQAKLLGIHTHIWTTSDGTQQTFILLYHCVADTLNVQLNPKENDAYSWNSLDELMNTLDLLAGTTEMIQALYVENLPSIDN